MRFEFLPRDLVSQDPSLMSLRDQVSLESIHRNGVAGLTLKNREIVLCGLLGSS